MPAEIVTPCHLCGRDLRTIEVVLYGNRFPAERLCRSCRERDRAEDDQRRGDALFAQAHVPAELRACSFANFEPILGNQDALRAAQSWSKELRSGGRPRRGLLLHGEPGAGKTHLSVAIVREFVFGTSKSALFLNVPEWLNDLKMSFRNDQRLSVPSPRGFELVVVDDLGTEADSSWTRDQVYSLINHRDANGLPTVVTTNLQLPDLQRRVGAPTFSRLRRLCQSIEIKIGIDWRERLVSDSERYPAERS